MRVIFLGTPDFALPSLEALIDSEHEVVCVVTQPDRVGNRNKLIPPPVKEAAIKKGVKVLQYQKVSKEGVAELESFKADIMVTCAFGQMLSQELLDLCPYGVINVHASLLPYYRGSSPIHWAVINGEKETGVTIMQTALEVDSGDIILQKKTEIYPDETTGELFNRLSVLGAEALLEALKMIQEGNAVYHKQDHSLATHVRMLKKEDGEIDFNISAYKLHDFVRGMNPWPGAYTYLGKDMLKVHRLSVANYVGEPAQVLYAGKEGLIVGCGGGSVRLEEIQPSGGKRMKDTDYLLGHKITVGTVLGERDE